MFLWLQLIIPYIVYSAIFHLSYKKTRQMIFPANMTNPLVVTAFKILKMAGCVLGLFTLSMMPVLVIMTLISINQLEITFFQQHLSITTVGRSLQLWINPLIYCRQEKEFKDGIKKMLSSFRMVIECAFHEISSVCQESGCQGQNDRNDGDGGDDSVGGVGVSGVGVAGSGVDVVCVDSAGGASVGVDDIGGGSVGGIGVGSVGVSGDDVAGGDFC